MDLRHLGAVGERLAVVGNTGPVGVDHHGIGEDHGERALSLTHGNSLPVFVSPELGEREAAQHLHNVLVLRGKGHSPTAASNNATITIGEDGRPVMAHSCVTFPKIGLS